MSLLRSLREMVYHDRLGPFFRRIGVGVYLSRAYWTLASFRAGDTTTVRVGDVAARFHIGSPAEYKRVRSLMGERPVIEQVLADLDAEDVFYDIGANIGIYAILAADTGADAVAVEPHPANTDRIAQNATLNDQDITTEKVAFADRDGDITLSTGDAGISQSIQDGEEGITAPVVRGDAYLAAHNLPAPTVLKIDVEGAELDVLRGLDDALKSVEVFYVEVHPDRLPAFDAESDDVETFLADHGFETETVLERGNEYFLRATHT